MARHKEGFTYEKGLTNIEQYWKTRLQKRIEKRWKKEAADKALLAKYVLAQAMPQNKEDK